MAESRLKRWFQGAGRFFRRTLFGRALVFASLPLLLLGIAFYQPDYHPPIFDAQVHYNEEAWKRVSVEAIINGVEEMNIPWLLVGSTPNLGTWKLWEADPDRVIPMLVPYDSPEDRFYWHENPAIIDFAIVIAFDGDQVLIERTENRERFRLHPIGVRYEAHAHFVAGRQDLVRNNLGGGFDHGPALP